MSWNPDYINIIESLSKVVRLEFGNQLPVIVGDEGKQGTQYLNIIPSSSSLLGYSVTQETREYSLSFVVTFAERPIKKTELDSILRTINRIEYLFHRNIALTLSDSTRLYDCRFESTEFDAEPESDNYIVTLGFMGVHSH